jgi:hypothetical protein
VLGVPARMQRSANSAGMVAKCAPLKGWVAMVQTLLALRPSR